MKREEWLGEVAYSMEKLDAATKELKEANSSFSLLANAKDITSMMKIITYAMLSHEETKDNIIYYAKKLKDKDLLTFLEKFEDV